jgi:hypothetical protein
MILNNKFKKSKLILNKKNYIPIILGYEKMKVHAGESFLDVNIKIDIFYRLNR